MFPGSDVRRIAEAVSPRGEIVLSERRTDDSRVLELRVNGVYVMDDHETSSEVALAQQALAASALPAKVLVGGLGLGFTATEVLGDPRVRELVVVEIEESLITWMRDGTVPHGPPLMDEPRLTVVNADLREHLMRTTDRYDLVLLDIDNGPDNLVHTGNASLYGDAGLTAVRRVLAEHGAVVIWSAGRSESLLSLMSRFIGPSSEAALPVHADSHPTDYYLYTAILEKQP